MNIMPNLIYRVENEKGKGPYCIGVDWGDDTGPYSGNHPGPYSDPGLSHVWDGLQKERAYQSWSFGFRDEEQLHRWFSKGSWLEGMKKAGLFIAIYEANDGSAHYGSRQAIFKKENATLIAKRELF